MGSNGWFLIHWLAQRFYALGTIMSPTVYESANPTNPNIEAIAKLEHEALLRRTPTERASDAITKLIGSIGLYPGQGRERLSLRENASCELANTGSLEMAAISLPQTMAVRCTPLGSLFFVAYRAVSAA